MKKIPILLACLWSLSCFSQTEIKIEDAKNHVGDSVKICSRIYDAKFITRHRGAPTFLNVGEKYPNARLRLVIWAEVREQFDVKPEEFYKGRNVCVYGRINLFRGRPEIVITSPDQIVETIAK